VRFESGSAKPMKKSNLKNARRVNAVSGKTSGQDVVQTDRVSGEYISVDSPEYTKFMEYQRALDNKCNAITTDQSVHSIHAKAGSKTTERVMDTL
jgi:hypothetical protein